MTFCHFCKKKGGWSSPPGFDQISLNLEWSSFGWTPSNRPSFTKIGEMACATPGWSSRGCTLKRMKKEVIMIWVPKTRNKELIYVKNVKGIILKLNGFGRNVFVIHFTEFIKKRYIGWIVIWFIKIHPIIKFLRYYGFDFLTRFTKESSIKLHDKKTIEKVLTISCVNFQFILAVNTDCRKILLFS